MNATAIGVPAVAPRTGFWRVGALAGLAGGTVEVAWIALYQNLAGQEGAAVARGVTQSVIPALVDDPVAVPLGIGIHMGLAIVLGISIAIVVNRALPRIVGTAMEPVVVIAALAGVWAGNFFVVLPAINPEFVSLVPYGASFVSKVLFGFAAAFVFWWGHRLRTRQSQNAGETSNVQ